MKLAIFQPADSERISVLIPAPNCELSLEEICRKDVPTGIKYKIIDSNLDKKVNKLLVINELEKLL